MKPYTMDNLTQELKKKLESSLKKSRDYLAKARAATTEDTARKFYAKAERAAKAGLEA